MNEHTSNVLSKVFYNLDEKPIYFYNYNGNNGYCKLTSSTHEIKLTDEIINYFNAVTLFVRNTL